MALLWNHHSSLFLVSSESIQPIPHPHDLKRLSIRHFNELELEIISSWYFIPLFDAGYCFLFI
jgi:hypothetical protein